MELKTIKKTSKELEVEVTGENETLLNPIAELLLKDKDVDYASYFSDHPESKKRRLYVKVKKGKPQEILLKTIKKLETEFKNFQKDIKSSSKK